MNIIVKWRCWREISNFGCFFIWSTECVEETDFGQLIVSQLKETENPL